MPLIKGKEIPLLIIIILQTGLIISTASEFYLGYFLIILFAIVLFLVTMPDILPYVLIAMIPLSQAIPIKFSGREIGIFPEYMLIPVIGFIVFLDLVQRKNLSRFKIDLFLPAFTFLAVAAISLIQAGFTFGFSKIIIGMGTLYVFILAMIMFFVIMEWYKDEVQAKRIVFALLLSSILISIIGIAQYFYLSQHEDRIVRIYSLFENILSKESSGNPNTFGTYLMMMVLLGIGLRNQFFGIKKKIVVVSILINIAAILLTASRSSLVGFLIGAFIIGVMLDRKILFGFIPIGIAILYFILAMPRMFERFISIFSILFDPKIYKLFSEIDIKSINWAYVDYYGIAGYKVDIVAGAIRFSTWIQGFSTFLKQPIIGIGLQMNYFYIGFPTSENFLLDIAVMTGLLGLAAVAWMILIIFKAVRTGMKQLATDFEKRYISTYFAILIGIMTISLTGSVMFTLKLILLFSILTGILFRISINK